MDSKSASEARRIVTCGEWDMPGYAYRDTIAGFKMTNAPRWRIDSLIGSMPLFVIAGAAAGDARNMMSALAASGVFAPAATPAENTVTRWTSGGSGPT